MLSQYSDDLSHIELFPQGKLFRISYDANVNEFRLLAKKYELLDEVREAFSAVNKSAFFVSRYGYRAEPKVYVINKFGYFGTGLLFEVLKWIKEMYSDLSCVAMSAKCKQFIADRLLPLKPIAPLFSIVRNIAEDTGRNNELKNEGKQPFEFRDYQEESLRQLFQVGLGRGLIEIPTAGGKSFILANFIWNLHTNLCQSLRCLILVPNKQLVEQFYKDLLDYGFKAEEVTRFTAGLRGKDAYQPNAHVVIGNRQYIFNNKKALGKIDVLIVDEVHTALSSATEELIKELSCKIQIGCSGTLPRDKFQKWKMAALFGKTVYAKEITSLQDSGFISKLKITLLKIKDTAVEGNRKVLFHADSEVKYHEDEFGQSNIEFDEAYRAEHKYFEDHYKDLYKPVFDYLFNLNTNTLILFDRIEIGKNLFELAKELYPHKSVYYIDGAIEVKEREKVRDSFEKCDGNLLLAQSSIFSTGINIRRLQNLVFLTSSKSFSRVIQSIGRTLRLHEAKDCAHVVDVSWVPFKYSQRHLNERLRIYKSSYKKTPDEVLTFTI